MKRTLITFFALGAAAIALSACGGTNVKKELGLGRNSPDEFMVVKRAPLTLPPDYDLRAPGTGAAPTASDPTATVKNDMLGQQLPAQANAADKELLTQMGAQNANPDIRAVLDKENGYIALKNKPVVDKLIFWNDGNQDPKAKDLPSSIVDPAAEAARIKKNQAEGKPLNEGDVPVIEKRKSTIDKIF